MIKNQSIFFVLILLLLLITSNNAQHQVHIPWPSLADSPWPVMRGDMQGTGRSQFVGPRSANYVLKKDMPLGIAFGPVIGYDDILFTGTAALNNEPSNFFYSLDDKLNTLWEFRTENAWPNKTGPVVSADSTIYFASNGGGVFALDYSGSVKWERDDILLGVLPFISISKSGNLFISEGRHRFIKLDKNGNTIIDTMISDFSTKEFLFSVGGDTVYFINWDDDNNKSIRAADLNLNVYWSQDIFNTKSGIPLIDNSNKIYIYTRDSVYTSYLTCYLPDGSIDWEYAFGGFSEFSSPTIDSNGDIILGVQNDTNRVEVISLDYNGNENWRTIVSSEQTSVFCSIICDAEGKIYLVSENSNEESYLYCVDSNGEILWEVYVGNHTYLGSPAINSEGTIFVGGFNSSFNPYHTKNLIAVSKTPLEVENDMNIKVNTFDLSQNYPKPFNPSTTIKYQVPNNGFVTIKVYDILGKEISALVNEYKAAGIYTVEFDAGNLPSGVYIYKIIAGKFTLAKKLMLMK